MKRLFIILPLLLSSIGCSFIPPQPPQPCASSRVPVNQTVPPETRDPFQQAV